LIDKKAPFDSLRMKERQKEKNLLMLMGVNVDELGHTELICIISLHLEPLTYFLARGIS